eukprot:4031423-Heterocapsa_arctica.AAC.1
MTDNSEIIKNLIDRPCHKNRDHGHIAGRETARRVLPSRTMHLDSPGDDRGQAAVRFCSREE